MLNGNESGYAVMNKTLDAYSFEDTNLETCMRYCRNGDVIAKQIPYVAGFSIRLMWFKCYKWFEWKPKYNNRNIFNLHIYWHKEYLHKTGEIVYRSN